MPVCVSNSGELVHGLFPILKLKSKLKQNVHTITETKLKRQIKGTSISDGYAEVEM